MEKEGGWRRRRRQGKGGGGRVEEAAGMEHMKKGEQMGSGIVITNLLRPDKPFENRLKKFS